MHKPEYWLFINIFAIDHAAIDHGAINPDAEYLRH